MAPVAALALGGHRYDEDAARSSKGLGMKGKKSYIKANFLPRLLLHAEVPVGRRGGGSRWRRPKSRTWMRHFGLLPSLGDMDGWGLPQQLDCGGCHVLPPAPGLEEHKRPWHASKSTCLQLSPRFRAAIVHK